MVPEHASGHVNNDTTLLCPLNFALLNESRESRLGGFEARGEVRLVLGWEATKKIICQRVGQRRDKTELGSVGGESKGIYRARTRPGRPRYFDLPFHLYSVSDGATMPKYYLSRPGTPGLTG